MRQTLDFGIDIGTTNSAIAMMDGVEPGIIKNNLGQEITPSAVGYTKTGVLRVGEAARRLQLGSPQDAYTEFKRRMGSDQVYDFAATGKKLKPEELSAELLKTLKADVEQARGEVVEAAVITVPAAFELHQCDATRRAAALAGFSTCPLVQEPVAAALAYGFQKEEERAYWLVYDFGGGTFDAAVIRAEEGIIHVVAHEGDNFLGGSDIDWALMQELLLPKLTREFDLPDFRRGNARWALAMQKLKTSVEKAKIEASRSKRAPLIECCFEDASGNEVDLEALGLELEQGEICRVAAPLISRSASLVKKVLAAKNLSTADLQKVILVGGPTQAPYFREQLQAELGASLDFSVDPMTVVARGAAVFASTQVFKERKTVAVAAGEFSLELKHQPTGLEPEPLVGGRVKAPAGVELKGYTIELANDKSAWTSGQVPVHEDGTFALLLSAERGVRNQFRITLRNSGGQSQKITPDSLQYTIGAAVDEQPIIHSLGVGLAGNRVRFFFTKGEGLPRKKMHRFTTARAVKAGQADSVLRVPVIEGESEYSDRNRLIGMLDIQGKNIHRELPGGQEVEVTLKMDESRKITVEVFIPYLDEAFSKELDTGRTAAANDPAMLKERLRKERERFFDLKDKADQSEAREASKILVQIQEAKLMEEIESRMQDAAEDFVTGEQCDRQILDLACQLDLVEDRIQWPEKVSEARTALKNTYDWAHESATQEQMEELDEVRDWIEEQIHLNDPAGLSQARMKLDELFREIVWDKFSFWSWRFCHLEGMQGRMIDRVRAESLIISGRRALAENHLQGVRDACRLLYSLLPYDKEMEAERGWDAGIA
jgi:molecular chaperone DnaK